MIAIAIGGHSRNVGKTSVAAGLIRALGEFPWTAIKISSHKHSNVNPASSDDGKSICRIYEETDREGSSDTSRFLKAGACRALWVRIDSENTDAGMQQLLPIIKSHPFAMIESNRILSVMRPELFIMVVRYDIGEFKDSARLSLKQSDAVVLINPDSLPPPWEGVSEILSGLPQFVTSDPQTIPSELIAFVRSRLFGNGSL